MVLESSSITYPNQKSKLNTYIRKRQIMISHYLTIILIILILYLFILKKKYH